MLEWRDVEIKTHGFSVVGTRGEAYPVAETAPEDTDWWSSVAGVGESCFLVHQYRNADIPEPTDLLGFDLGTGRLQWVLPGYRFAGFSLSGRLVAGKKSGGGLLFFDCDERSGTVSGEPLADIALAEPGWSGTTRYSKEDEYYGLLRSFVEKNVGLSPAGAIEYLDYADKMVFSFYLYESNRMTQYVAVVNRLREVKYVGIMEENLEKEGRSVLLLKEGILFFVRNKRNFVGVNLTF